MAAVAQLAPVLDAGGPALAQGLGATERRLDQIAGEHGIELGRHIRATLAAGGKRLRPVLVFLCGGAATGPLVRAATAVELLHMATLVHDDVLDAAPLRRGQPTVYATAGRAAATATGDLLFSRAFAELVQTASPEAVASLSRASNDLANGELMQREDAFSTGVDAERYARRCALKTASLFAASCRIGAVLGERGSAAEQAMEQFGSEIGLAFQILDDVLDVSGPVQRTGKARGTDLLDGTATLPLILARGHDPALAALDPRTVADTRRAEQVCDQIEATGALAEARERALDHVAQAKRVVAELDLTAEAGRALDLVADGVVERYA